MKDISRRRFLGQSAGTAAGITTGLAAMTQAVAASANDKIVMALIGCGGRGFSHVRGFVSRGDVDFKYVAEVNDKKVVDCMKWLDENHAPFRWVDVLYGYGPRKGVSEPVAATYLLLDAMHYEAEECSLRMFDWIGDEGTLSVPELLAISRAVWPTE